MWEKIEVLYARCCNWGWVAEPSSRTKKKSRIISKKLKYKLSKFKTFSKFAGDDFFTNLFKNTIIMKSVIVLEGSGEGEFPTITDFYDFSITFPLVVFKL